MLNPHETDRLMERMQKISQRGITILLIEHDMNLVMRSTQHLIVLNFGKKIFDGSAEDSRKDPDVIKAYLGEEYAAC